MERKHNDGALIDLSQIKHGKELEEVLRKFDMMDQNVRYQIKVSFEKRFNELSKKYNTIMKALEGDFDQLDEAYGAAITELRKDLMNHEIYAENTYVKKGNIDLEDLSDTLREKIYKLLAEESDNMFDNNGNLREISWSVYFVLFGSSIVYLDDVTNKSTETPRVITKEMFFGPNHKDGNYTNSSVELWAYNNPAESYLPLNIGYVKVSDTDTYIANNNYYTKSGDSFILAGIIGENSKEKLDSFNEQKHNLYYFDETIYENALIDVLEKNKYDMTYVRRHINTGEFDDNDNMIYQDDPLAEGSVDPTCGKVTYNANSRRFSFDNVAEYRQVFKLVKYYN